MQVLGVDFTSRPSTRKPITCVRCTFENDVLHAGEVSEWQSYERFESALAEPGPWIAGIDFPFGQSRRFIETIGWPAAWPDYVKLVGRLDREEFRKALNDYKADRPDGDKEHRRKSDILARSISPQKLYGVPVALMFFEGAPRLLKSGATIPFIQAGDPERLVVEGYPGVLARRLIGRRSYKNDTRRKQTEDQREARFDLIRRLREVGPELYGFDVKAEDRLCEDPGADHLDALLCAVQAAWAWKRREDRFGAPRDIDPVEGWIADPALSESTSVDVP